MSDRKLRDLERRMIQNEPGAREAWLSYRLAFGDVQPENVLAAAVLGDEAARSVSKERLTWPVYWPRPGSAWVRIENWHTLSLAGYATLAAWLEEDPWSLDGHVLLVMSLLEALGPVSNQEDLDPGGVDPAWCIDMAHAFLASTDRDAFARAHGDLLEEVEGDADFMAETTDSPHDMNVYALCGHLLAMIRRGAYTDAYTDYWTVAAAIEDTAHHTSGDLWRQIAGHIQRRVVPWLLGEPS